MSSISSKQLFYPFVLSALWLLILNLNRLSVFRLTPDVALICTFVFQMIFMCSVYFLTKSKGVTSFFRNVGLVKCNIKYFLILPFVLFGFFVFNFIYNIGVYLFDPTIPTQAEHLLSYIYKTSYPTFFFILATFVAPIVEETFFRGYFFSQLNKSYSFLSSSITTSLIFALMHGIARVQIPIFVLGMIFCYLLKKSNSILPGIVLHMIINITGTIALYYIKSLA